MMQTACERLRKNYWREGHGHDRCIGGAVRHKLRGGKTPQQRIQLSQHLRLGGDRDPGAAEIGLAQQAAAVGQLVRHIEMKGNFGHARVLAAGVRRLAGLVPDDSVLVVTAGTWLSR